jgi:hypothetical protein
MQLVGTRFLVPLVSAAACASPKPSPVASSSPTSEIARQDVEAAQRGWCASLIEIGRVGAASGDYKATANAVLTKAYDYDAGTVLFKPTLTFGAQTFRMTKQGALAYFVGGDSSFPDDKGFALRPWVECEPTIAGVFAHGDVAIAMGNVRLKDAKGDVVTVDKTFGYLRRADGALRIVLHHSSLPFAPPR